MRWILVLLCLGGLGLLAVRFVPPAWAPWAPLDLRDRPNMVTRWKLGLLSGRPEACRATLATGGVPVVTVPDRPSDTGCDVTGAVRLAAETRIAPAGPTVTCPVAVAWALFDRYALQPAAERYLDASVVAVRHLGTYACRNVNNETAGRRSQHANANAIDVAGFVLSDGREFTVLRHWDGSGPEAAFLHAVRDGACRWFSAVLSPDYNAAHRNHFHLDRGPWRVCR